MEKDLFLPEASSVTGFLVIGSPQGLLAVWVVLVNLAAFLAFGLDKWKAKRKEKKASVRRVSEKTLFLSAVLGGSVGAIAGMYLFHHKTRHWYFRYGLPALLALQILCFLWAARRFGF